MKKERAVLQERNEVLESEIQSQRDELRELTRQLEDQAKKLREQQQSHVQEMEKLMSDKTSATGNGKEDRQIKGLPEDQVAKFNQMTRQLRESETKNEALKSRMETIELSNTQNQAMYQREVAHLRDQIASEKQMAAQQAVMRNNSEIQLNAQRTRIDELVWENTENNKEWQTSYDQLVMIAVIGWVAGLAMLVMVIVFGITGCRLKRRSRAMTSKLNFLNNIKVDSQVAPKDVVASEDQVVPEDQDNPDVLERGARLRWGKVLDEIHDDFQRAKRIRIDEDVLSGDEVNQGKDPARVDSSQSE